ALCINNSVIFIVLSLPGMFSQTSCSNCEEHSFCTCSKKGFYHIPQVPFSALGLDLSLNNIEMIDQGDLEAYTELLELNLHKSKLNVICSHPFKSQNHLEFLDLSDNHLTNLSSSWFENLLFLPHLNILGNNYTTLGSNPIFHTLANLRILKFGNPHLQKLEKHVLYGLDSLTKIEFYCSNLKAYKNGSLHPNKPLSAVTIRNALTTPGNIHITSSILYDVSHPSTAMVVLDFLLTDNISVLPLWEVCNAGVKKNHFLKWNSKSRLIYLEFDNVELQGDGQWYGNATHTLLETIHIRKIYITKLFNFSLLKVFPFDNIHKLSIVECNVFVVHYLTIQQGLCYGRGTIPHLNTLNISQNFLRSIGEISQLVFQFKKLTSLDLSKNNFNDIPENCGWPLNLTFLNLSSTKLYQVTPYLPQSLNILDLTDNDLTTFFPFTLFIQRNTLNMFAKSDLSRYMRLQSLEAGQNNFVCSCEFVTFLQCDVENFVTLTDACDSPLTFQGQKIKSIQMSIFVCHMIPAISILCIETIVVFFLCGFTCYKLYILWYLKMTWAWLQAKHKSAVSRNTNVIYDAFVSYSDHDSEWVEELLVPELEKAESSFALCLHKRNFQPGHWILDNIIDSIEKSHCTLFVLSEHFVMSEWCRYELDFAHFHIFDENNDSVVLILLEPIDKKSIPKRFCKLRKVMNSKTYLEWPTEEDMRAEFWHNLKAALRRDKS
uniref:TIR domain-containing protein n=1 Tax=Electrophorus electricus TaxID=8005 RepID=A0A4W4GUR5_ELEEL